MSHTGTEAPPAQMRSENFLLASSAATILLGRGAAILLGVVLSTVLFHSLGARIYGAWSLLTVVAGYSTLIDFGLSTALERRVAHLWTAGQRVAVVRTLNSAVILISAVLGGSQVVTLSAWLVFREGTLGAEPIVSGLLVLPLCLGVTLAGLAVGSVLAGQQRWRTQQACRTAGLAAGAVVTASSAVLGVTRLDVLLMLYTSGSVLALISSWQAIRRELPELQWRIDWDGDAVRELVKLGSSMQIATVVPPLGEYGFRVIVGRRFGLEYSGLYDLAARAAVVLRSLAGALFTAMVPLAVRLNVREGAAGLARLTDLATRYVAFFILPSTAILLAYSSPLIGLWLGSGPPVEVVRRLFVVLLVAHALGALGVPAAMVARAVARPGAEAIATTIGFTFAVVLVSVLPSVVAAAGVLWGLPALAGLLLWGYLAKTLGLSFHSGRELTGATMLALGIFGLAYATRQLGTLAGSWISVLGLTICIAMSATATFRVARSTPFS